MYSSPIHMYNFQSLMTSLRIVSPPIAAATAPQISSSAEEQVVTPWDVKGQVSSDGRQMAIDYDKLIEQFGTRRIDEELLARFEKLTGFQPHPLLRRGLFFSHR